MYPDDRVLVAVMNNPADWQLVQDERWYRIPTKKAPSEVPHIDWLAFYFTARFNSDRHAIHYYAAVEGHELVARRDLFPDEANHPRADQWYYKLYLGPLRHKLPPIVSHKWRRITFISTTGDRFEAAVEINDLFDRESPLGRLYVSLKEEGFSVEQFWTMQEGRHVYMVDLALNTPQGWLPINLTSQLAGSGNILQLSDSMTIVECQAKIRERIDYINRSQPQ